MRNLAARKAASRCGLATAMTTLGSPCRAGPVDTEHPEGPIHPVSVGPDGRGRGRHAVVEDPTHLEFMASKAS